MRTLARVALSLVPFLSIAACTYRSPVEDFAARQRSSLALHVDTAAGSDAIRALVGGVVFERIDGSIGNNCLPQPVELTIADPAAAANGLGLRRPEDGTYVALHLFLRGTAVRALHADGSVSVVSLPSPDLRVPFDEPYTTTSSKALLLRHDSVPAFVRDAHGDLSWTPSLRVREADDVVVCVPDAVVASVDHAARTAIVMLPSYQDLSFELQLGNGSILFGADGMPRDANQFLGSIRPGAMLSLEAIGSAPRQLACWSAQDRGVERGAGEFLGRIRELDPATKTLVIDVQARVFPGRIDPAPLSSLSVDASSAIIRSGHCASAMHLEFTDLEAGMLVQVEGTAPAHGASIARAVQVQVDVGRHPSGEVHGLVTSVDPVGSTIQLGPRQGESIVIGGTTVRSVTVQVDPGTGIVVRDGGRREGVRGELGRVVPGAPIDVRGEFSAPGVVEARFVRVDPR